MHLRCKSDGHQVEIVSLAGRYGWLAVDGIVTKTIMIPWSQPYIEPKPRFWDRFAGWKNALIVLGVLISWAGSFALAMMETTCP